MRTIFVTIILLALSATSMADDYKVSFGGGAGMVNLSGSDFYSFDWEKSFSFGIAVRPHERWTLSADYSFFTLTNDASADSVASVDDIPNNAPLDMETSRIGLLANRLLLDPDRKVNFSAGFGGGVMMWKMTDIATDQPFEVTGGGGETREFKASELFLTGTAGLVLLPTSRLSINLDARADYLTHAGADFSPEVKETLGRWLLGVGISLNFRIGGSSEGSTWRSDSSWTVNRQRPRPTITRSASDRDSDADGVNDKDDRCLNTPQGVVVDRNGCAMDTDFDGVPDGLDDCPGSDPGARGKVDIYGCPVDTDFDGVPDYADGCPSNPVGAVVDDRGCPVDSDADGVPDGLDDCPGTLYGMDVDKYGCIDLSVFAKPMVLYIDYPPGSFEIDPNSKERIKQLSGILNFVPEIKLEIHGYTDNIGTAIANKQLSQKRANRVSNYLITLGVAADRIKVFGRGEENFIASNDTAEGRARNRRIEIIFYR